MSKYLIALNGCDDSTMCELELNHKEVEFLIKIAKEINKKSSYMCQPRIRILASYKYDGYTASGYDLVEVKE